MEILLTYSPTNQIDNIINYDNQYLISTHICYQLISYQYQYFFFNYCLKLFFWFGNKYFKIGN